MFSLAFYTFKQDLLLKPVRHLHLNETLWAAVAPLNLHGVKTGSEVFILLRISKDARRLRIKFLVHSWPSKFSMLCSSCYIGIHKSLPPVLSPSQRCFCAPLGGSTSPLTSAAPCKLGGKKEVFLQLNLIFNSCKAAECPAWGHCSLFHHTGICHENLSALAQLWAAPATQALNEPTN